MEFGVDTGLEGILKIGHRYPKPENTTVNENNDNDITKMPKEYNVNETGIECCSAAAEYVVDLSTANKHLTIIIMNTIQSNKTTLNSVEHQEMEKNSKSVLLAV